MSERNWRLFLLDIRESASRVLEYAGSMSREEFLGDSKTVDAVIRNLAIIGEAAKKVPADIRRRYPAVEWKKMAGLRDIVVHDYFGIDEDIIWDVVSVKMPELLQQIEWLTGELSST
ncbi:MAG: hypothetical protein FD174_3083 [Geobacteraceae bacterium]|nr:MAG: hypothetical protein FD174_3083 [Geobacteraceae bacterium]